MRSRSTRVAVGVVAVAAAVGLHALVARRTPSALPPAPVAPDLLAGPVHDLPVGTAGWQARIGQAALRVGDVLALTAGDGSYGVAQSAPAPAVPGLVYAGQLSVRAGSRARHLVPALVFRDLAGRVLTSVQGESGDDSTRTWRDLSPVVALAPGSAATVSLALTVRGAGRGEAHLLRDPRLAEGLPSARRVVGPLHTAGTQLLDARGPLSLHGLHRFGLESSPRARQLTPADLGQARAWGADVVRLSISSAFWLASSCHHAAGYAATVDAAVRTITSLGMVALVDLHTNALTPCGPVGPQPMADVSALAFWQQVAQRYAGNPLVAFDLYNEPHGIPDDVWLRGGRVTVDGTTFVAAGMQQMYDAVRGTGARNLVVVSGNDYANRLPALRVEGTDVLYAAHAYTCPERVDRRSCSAEPYRPDSVLSGYTTVRAPVAITEFGWPDARSGRYNAQVVALARDRGWGWIAFAWDGSTDGRFSLLSSAQAGGTYEPSPSGMPVLAGMSGGA